RDCTDQFLVLVADDSPSVRRRCRNALENEGCRVLEAMDGSDAFELATRALPDVILLDEVMPTSGLECARLLKGRRRTRHIPNLMRQVGTDEEHVSDALAAGLDEFLAKPLHMREMVTRVLQPARAHRNCRRLSRVNRRIRRQEWVLRHLLELFRSAASQRQVSAVTENAIHVAARSSNARQVCILLADE